MCLADIQLNDALMIAADLEEAASLRSPLQAPIAARLRVAADTIRMQQRRLDAWHARSAALRTKLAQIAEAI